MASMIQTWRGWSAGRKAFLIAGTASIVLMASVFAWWALRTRYDVLFANLRDTDAAEIAAALDAMQVPHRYAEDGGTLLVPSDLVYDTRLKLVGQGVPHGGSVGFESFKDADFGVTEFSQRVNYQRAVQGELERTIASEAGVASVRVHLTMRRAGLFDGDQAPAKGSVSLTLRPDAVLSSKQVGGIQRLVASAVDGLQPDNVTVIGPGGVPLSAAVGTGDHGEEQSAVEGRLRQRVESMLHGALGEDAPISVSVDVRLDYDRVKRVSDRLIEQGKDGNGLLLHQKTASGRAAPSVDGEAPKSGGSDAELDFAHGREQEEVERAPGRIDRISIGVLVPAGVDANTVNRLAAVISAATGLDTQRGDRLDIAAVATRAMPSSPSHGRSSPVPPAATGQAKPQTWPDMPFPWLGLAAGVALAGVTAGLGFGLGRARTRARRLTQAEREHMLADVRRWIGVAEKS